jgi:hypothetical protein
VGVWEVVAWFGTGEDADGGGGGVGMVIYVKLLAFLGSCATSVRR